MIQYNEVKYAIDEIEKDLDSLIGYNSTAVVNEKVLSLFFERNKSTIKSLMFEFASSEVSRYTAPYGKFIVHVDKRGRDWKAFIINNAFGNINAGNFDSRQIKPFNSITNNGLSYIEFSADHDAVKILLIKYMKAAKIITANSEIAKDPSDQGHGYHHINDVFNIMQHKSSNIAVDEDIKVLSEDDIDINDRHGLIANIIRASVYLFNNAYQTVSVSDSIYLNKRDIYDDSEAIHKRCAAYYTPGNVSDVLAFTNFRNQLTYKNKENAISKTACNHIGACFTVDKSITSRTAVEKLNYISLQPSIGFAIEFRW